MDPKKGIEYLQEHGLLQATPEDVAAYLYKGEGLNKTAIGDYLGEKNPFNEKVLKAFVELHDFTDLILVQALRYFYQLTLRSLLPARKAHGLTDGPSLGFCFRI